MDSVKFSIILEMNRVYAVTAITLTVSGMMLPYHITLPIVCLN